MNKLVVCIYAYRYAVCHECPHAEPHQHTKFPEKCTMWSACNTGVTTSKNKAGIISVRCTAINKEK